MIWAVTNSMTARMPFVTTSINDADFHIKARCQFDAGLA